MTFHYVHVDNAAGQFLWIPAFTADSRWVAFMAAAIGGTVEGM